MSATRWFSCIAFPFPRVVLGSKNIRAKIFGPAKPLLSRVGDRQPVQQTLVVPQRQCLRLVVDLSLHRSLPPTRGTTKTLILYPSLLEQNLKDSEDKEEGGVYWTPPLRASRRPSPDRSSPTTLGCARILPCWRAYWPTRCPLW